MSAGRGQQGRVDADAASDPVTLGELGELAALARIIPRLPAASATEVGPGDDAAVVAAPDGRVVVTTDSMIEGPDFRLDWSTPFQIGWKAAASNLADVAAMGARPTALVVALAAPAGTDVAVLEGIADGLREGCAALAPGCGVVGGDLATAPVLTLAVTAFGDLEGRAPVRRSGARAGDRVAVSGDLAAAARGLALLRAAPTDPPLRDPAVRQQLAPEPPVGDGPVAARGGATAMLDVSDGLLLDARRIAAASRVRLDLDSSALETPLPAGFGAESHALLATFPDDDRPLPGGFRLIGRVVAGRGVTIDGVEPGVDGGWDPFRDYAGSTAAGPDASSSDSTTAR